MQSPTFVFRETYWQICGFDFLLKLVFFIEEHDDICVLEEFVLRHFFEYSHAVV